MRDILALAHIDALVTICLIVRLIQLRCKEVVVMDVLSLLFFLLIINGSVVNRPVEGEYSCLDGCLNPAVTRQLKNPKELWLLWDTR